MKKNNAYVSPEIEIILIEAEDICTLSVAESGDATPKNWVDIWNA